MADKTLRELQASLPWTGHYHRDFRSTPMTHKDFSHALLHIHKAGGKLASIIDEAEHAGYAWESPANRADVQKYIADMVICALRMANTCPDGVIDLQRAVEERLVAKNNQREPLTVHPVCNGSWTDGQGEKHPCTYTEGCQLLKCACPVRKKDPSNV